jgi:hypothetical protein
MWKAIQYVTSGITLVAFVVAAAVFLFSRSSRSKAHLVQTAHLKDRSTLVEQALKDELVNVEAVPPDERTVVILEILRTRARRHQANAIVICFAAALATAIAAYSISRSSLNSSGSAPRELDVRLGESTPIRDRSVESAKANVRSPEPNPIKKMPSQPPQSLAAKPP